MDRFEAKVEIAAANASTEMHWEDAKAAAQHVLEAEGRTPCESFIRMMDLSYKFMNDAYHHAREVQERLRHQGFDVRINMSTYELTLYK